MERSYFVALLALIAIAFLGSTYLSYTGVAAGSRDFDFSISLSPTNGSVAPGFNTISTITVTYLKGSNRTVSLTASGQPTGVSISFNPSSVTTTATSKMTITTSPSTGQGIYLITVTGSGGGNMKRTTTYTLTVSSGSIVNLPCKDCGSGSGRPATSGFRCNADGSVDTKITKNDDYLFCTCLSDTLKDCTIKGNSICEPQESNFCETIDCGTVEQKSSCTQICSQKVCAWNATYSSNLDGTYAGADGNYTSSCYSGENCRATVCGNGVCETLPGNYASEDETSCPRDCSLPPPNASYCPDCVLRPDGSAYRCGADGKYDHEGALWCTCLENWNFWCTIT